MKRYLLISLLFCLVSPNTIMAEKKPFGNGLFWELDNGVLTISGNGNMPNFSTFSETPWYYKNFNRVVIKEGVCSIGDYAFDTKPEIIEIPNSVTTIGDYAFYSCRNLLDVMIPSSIKSIGKSAFEECRNLSSVILPNSITIIRTSTFSGCAKLRSVVLPKSLKDIESWAFRGCPITTIEFPISLSSIGMAAFVNTNLTSVEIPRNVTIIGDQAFGSCSRLQKVKIFSNNIALINSPFYDCNSINLVELPYDLLQRGEQQWKLWGLPIDAVNEFKHKLRDKDGKAILFSDDIKASGGYASAVEMKNGSTSFYKVSKNGRYGLTDAEGKVIVPVELEALATVGDGFLKYKLNGFWGVMNYSGKIIIDTDRGYTSIGDFVTFTKRFPYTMLGYKGECDVTGKQISKIKVDTPQQTTTASSSSNASSSSSNTGTGTSTIVVEHHRDPVPVQQWQACFACGGMGTMGCDGCGGSGTKYIGDRLHRCSRCNGRGVIPCNVCFGNKGKYITVYQ